jgi:hypothetical protein
VLRQNVLDASETGTFREIPSSACLCANILFVVPNNADGSQSSESIFAKMSFMLGDELGHVKQFAKVIKGVNLNGTEAYSRPDAKANIAEHFAGAGHVDKPVPRSCHVLKGFGQEVGAIGRDLVRGDVPPGTQASPR